MDSNNEFITILLNKEKELNEQLASVRGTIKLFQNGSPARLSDPPHGFNLIKTEIPKTWDEAITWNQKLLFALNRIQEGFVTEIVDEILKLWKDGDKDVVFKRITSLASVLKKEKILGAKQVGIRYKYYIK